MGNEVSGEPPAIPDKVYFKIGEATKLIGVEAHVLRYWESEFKILRPKRAAGRQRLYRRVDIENGLRIKRLLHEEGYSIAGARKKLEEQAEGLEAVIEAPDAQPARETRKSAGVQDLVCQVKKELLELREMLEKK